MAHFGFYFYFMSLETVQISSEEGWQRGCAVPSVWHAAVSVEQGGLRFCTPALRSPIPAHPKLSLSMVLHLQLAASRLGFECRLGPGFNIL